VDRTVTDSPHRIVNPDGLAEPKGFAHAVAATEGTTIFLGGQTGHRADGALAGDDLVARPEHLVSLVIHAVDVGEYRARLEDLGRAYRRHFGKHFPAVALLGTTELFDPMAKVELIGVAVVAR
jgi:enamine deaminase RidA (YjgF/YER057c/UK114 family)